MTWEDVVYKTIEYFKNHEDDDDADVMDFVHTLNWQFHADIPIPGDTHYHEMTKINEVLGDLGTLEIMRMAINGSDDYGGDFNLDRDYFYIDDDNTLQSTDSPDIVPNAYLYEPQFIEALYDYRDDLNLPKYIEKVFNAYAADTDDDEEEDDEE